MNTDIREKDLIHKKERMYFILATIVSILSYISFILSGFGILIIAFFSFFSFFFFGIMLGYIRTNGVRIHSQQFPEVYEIVTELSAKMGLSSVPDVYVMQSGGVLNAFATRFFGRNMVVLYSEIFELVERNAKDELAFVIAHELAHIKRRHISKQMLILPSMWIPFVGEAYSRACEYTCDRYAAHYIENPEAAKNSLTILAIGKELYKSVNHEEYLRQVEEEKGLFVWLSEKLSTHPALPKRIHEIEVFSTGTSPISISRRSGKKILAGILIFVALTGAIGFGGTYMIKELEKLDIWSIFETTNPPLIQAVIDANTEEVNNLIEQGVDVNEQDLDGNTALHWAVSDQNKEVLIALLKAGADPNIRSFTEDTTPLTDAIRFGNVEFIKILIDYGADVNAQDGYDQTPLIDAVIFGSEDEKITMEMVQTLLGAGADPSLKDLDGWTALQYAVDNGDKEVAKLLRNHMKKESE